MSTNALLRTALVAVALAQGSIGCTAKPAATTPSTAPTAAPGAFVFHEIGAGVYHAVRTGSVIAFGNAVIIVNRDDVLVIDTHATPAAASALQADLKKITTKPVRYVINTHFHFDHTHGNQAYPAGAEIIGHEYTHQMLASGASSRGRLYDRYVGSEPDVIQQMEADLAKETDPAKRTALEADLAKEKAFLSSSNAVQATPPTATFDDRMTLFRGGREIQLLFLGRGHTAGDVLVYLPGEKILVTGDLIVDGIPYMGDAFFEEWIATLDRVKQLDFTVMLPGHGMAIRDRSKIDALQAYLKKLWTDVTALHAQGVRAEDAARRLDLGDLAKALEPQPEPGADIDAVSRAYELLDARGSAPPAK